MSTSNMSLESISDDEFEGNLTNLLAILANSSDKASKEEQMNFGLRIMWNSLFGVAITLSILANSLLLLIIFSKLYSHRQ